MQGVGLFFEMQDCPTGCPGPKDTAWLLPQPPLGDRDTATPVEPQCACWGAPSPDCYNPATGQCSTACGCVSVADACYAEGCDAGKIDNDSIPWRVMFFLACIPGGRCLQAAEGVTGRCQLACPRMTPPSPTGRRRGTLLPACCACCAGPAMRPATAPLPRRPPWPAPGQH